MAVFYVNGERCDATDMSLLDFLREVKGITSVKNGCGEGVCGSCTVLIDGMARRACTAKLEKLDGAHVVTVEGLPEAVRIAFVDGFAAAGAVQCGFCIPGMVISGAALLSQNSHPTCEQVRRAIKGNICRCTGYKKIEEGILLAAATLRGEGLPVQGGAGVGGASYRVDGAQKVLGTGLYAADYRLPDMLYGGAVRSEYARAEILSIDVSAVRALQGVACVITADMLPGAKKTGHIKQDWDILIGEGECVRYAGDALVLIAAVSPSVLEQAKRLVRVKYRPLAPILSPQDALKEGAPQLHEGGNILLSTSLVRGDAQGVLQSCAHTVTRRYTTPINEHAFLEPESALADYDGKKLTIISGDQGVYQTRKECAAATGLPIEKVRVKAALVGGGFGGKEDMSVQHHAALLSLFCKKPVSFTLSRRESIRVHPKRHPMDITLTVGCDEQGRIKAVIGDITSDTGAYASLGGPVLGRACTHLAGPYAIEHVSIVGRAVYTNNPPCGAFRGFGVTQSCFAMEHTIDLLAETVGISPYDIRYLNAVRPGMRLPNGQIAHKTELLQTLKEIKPYYDRYFPRVGIACAFKNSGLGNGIADVGRCKLVVADGTVQIHTSAACIGQGLGTVLTQIVSEVTGIDVSLIKHMPADTDSAPDSGNTTASRQTMITGEATRRAALLLKADLKRNSLDKLQNFMYHETYESKTSAHNDITDDAALHLGYGYATQVVALNEHRRPCHVVAAHDVGKAINPTLLEGQIHGGVAMSLGYALHERFPMSDGVPTGGFGALKLCKSTDVPDITAIIVERPPSEDITFGAVGIGEICSIPTPAAVALAYYHSDGKERLSLPIEADG